MFYHLENINIEEIKIEKNEKENLNEKLEDLLHGRKKEIIISINDFKNIVWHFNQTKKILKDQKKKSNFWKKSSKKITSKITEYGDVRNLDNIIRDVQEWIEELETENREKNQINPQIF